VTTGPNTIKHYYANGQRIATRDKDGLKFNHADILGSASKTSNTSGAEVRAIRYDPWGATQAAWGSGTAVVKYTYTGKEQDATGLYYYGARYYDPALGRFLTLDAMGGNYVYANNNPVKYIDPDGNVSTAQNWGESRVPMSMIPGTPQYNAYQDSIRPSISGGSISEEDARSVLEGGRNEYSGLMTAERIENFKIRNSGEFVQREVIEPASEGMMLAGGSTLGLKEIVATGGVAAVFSTGVQAYMQNGTVDLNRVGVDTLNSMGWAAGYKFTRGGGDAVMNKYYQVRYADRINDPKRIPEYPYETVYDDVMKTRTKWEKGADTIVVGGSVNYVASTTASIPPKLLQNMSLSEVWEYATRPDIYLFNMIYRGAVPQDKDFLMRELKAIPLNSYKKYVELQTIKTPGNDTGGYKLNIYTQELWYDDPETQTCRPVN